MPIVSFIIPTFNSMEYIQPLIQELVKLENSEIIFSDDGSTDGTQDFLKSSIKTNTNFKLIENNHKGASSSRNVAIIKASGQYVSFIDSDDLIRPSVLNKLIKRLGDNPIDVEYHSAFYDSEIIELSLTKDDAMRKKIMRQLLGIEKADLNIIPGPFLKFYNRNIISNNGILFPLDVIVGEDLIFNLNVIAVADSVRFVRGNYYLYRQHRESVSKRNDFDIEKNAKAFLSHVFKSTSLESSDYGKVLALTSLNDNIKALKNGNSHLLNLILEKPFDQIQPDESAFSWKQKLLYWLLMKKTFWAVKVLTKQKNSVHEMNSFVSL